MYQGMEDRAHVAMNTSYDFVNYISMGTLDLGNGAINPEESFSKEHWLSSIGLASILAGGAKPIVRATKTPSLQDRNFVLEKTIDKAHDLTSKTKTHVNYVIGEVRGGIHVLLHEMNDNNNLAYSLNGEGTKIPFKVMDTEAVKKVLDTVLTKFSLSGVGKGTGKSKEINRFTKEQLDTKPLYSRDPEKWLNKGGKIEIDEDGTWTYIDWEVPPNKVSYPQGFPDFKYAGFVKQEVKIGKFEKYDIDFARADELAPNGPKSDENTWHHHEDLTTMQEVNKEMHRRFRHKGGMSLAKKSID
jgi:hypothetical protein